MTPTATETPPPASGSAQATEPTGPARPSVTQILIGHIIVTACYSLLFVNVMWLMPMLVRLHFGADDPSLRDTQTTLVTAAFPVFMLFSIFWNELLRRMSLRRYLVVYWLAAVLPLALISVVQSYTQLIVLHIIASAGQGGWTPLSGKVLKHFYADAVRGRAYAVLNLVGHAVAIGSAFFVGRWIETDENAFRVYLPIAAGFQLVSLFVLYGLSRATGAPDQPIAREPLAWSQVLAPILHMREVLRSDRTFARYETAFMTYGAAFMICDALLPILATTRLEMRYEDYAHSTQMMGRIAMLACTLPMGWIHDRAGPIRTSCLAFTILISYPLLLLVATGPTGVGIASVMQGIAMAAVQMGWMLGPVVLAGAPERVPQYVAIHSTLVGFRGLIFQGLGLVLYRISGSFAVPLVLASVLFTHAAIQMWQLSRARELARQRTVEFSAE